MQVSQVIGRLGVFLLFAAISVVPAGTLGAQLGATCKPEGEAWQKQLTAEPGQESGDFTEIVFQENVSSTAATVCYVNREFGEVGEPIHVAMLMRRATSSWSDVKFEPCKAQSAVPKILVSPKAAVTGYTPAPRPAWYRLEFLSRRCYDTSVDVTISGMRGDAAIAARYSLSQYEKYRGTIQGGFLFTKLHDDTFGLRPDPLDASKHYIYNKGPTETGPEYIATVNIYSVLRYLPSLFDLGGGRGRHRYDGRDPINDTDAIDRLGAVIGASITNPTHRFAAGTSFELMYGVSAIWVMDFARVTRLAGGVSTTANYTGTAADIPTKDVWLREAALGLSMDVRYLSSLLTGNK